MILFFKLLHLNLILIVHNYFFCSETSLLPEPSHITHHSKVATDVTQNTLFFDQILNSHTLIHRCSKTVKLPYLKCKFYNERTARPLLAL